MNYYVHVVEICSHTDGGKYRRLWSRRNIAFCNVQITLFKQFWHLSLNFWKGEKKKVFAKNHFAKCSPFQPFFTCVMKADGLHVSWIFITIENNLLLFTLRLMRCQDCSGWEKIILGVYRARITLSWNDYTFSSLIFVHQLFNRI